jgi:YVTN family beta-propeller protein
MRRRLGRLVGLYGMFAMSHSSVACAQEKSPRGDWPLKVVADIAMPGPAVRFDYQSFDPDSRRLYVAHMNADQLVVFDTTTRKVIANLDGFARVHGVIVVPAVNRVFASVTAEGKLGIVDASSLQIITKVGPINYPDGLAYAPGSKRVFVSDEHGDADVVFDAQTNTFLKKIDLGGGAGNTVYDPTSERILVAVHKKDELVAIDPVKMEIAGAYPLPGVKQPHGVALDVEAHLAFVAGQSSRTLGVVDLATMKVLDTYPIGKSADVLAFDPGLKQLYIAAESGDVWVYRESGRRLVAVGSFSMPHAHTVCVDPRTHLVYFPLENFDGKPVLRIMSPDSVSR